MQAELMYWEQAPMFAAGLIKGQKRRQLCALAALLALVSASHEAAAQQQCALGSSVTLRLTLKRPIESISDEWLVIGSGALPCFVDTLVGKGKVPAACADGKTLEASGIVKKGEYGVLGVILEVSDARCR